MISSKKNVPAEYDVIITCNYSPWSKYSGGAQKSVHMLATAMAQQGLQVAAVYSKTPWDTIAPHPVPIYTEHWAGFFAMWAGISSPLRFLNGILFYFKVRSLSSTKTVIHGNGDEASLFSFIRKKKCFCYTNRYPEFPAFLSGRDWTKVWSWLAIFFCEPRFIAMALGMRRADKVTVTSLYSAEGVADNFGLRTHELVVVPNGVDPIYLKLPIEEKSGRGILFFGRLTHAKGPDLALEAYALLPSEIRSAHPLRFLGVGPFQVSLMERAKALGLTKVEFLGWKCGNDLAKEIAGSRIVCLPSREESFGNSVVETLALGIPLISSRAGSIPEVSGPWGQLAESEDALGLAALIQKELSDGMSYKQRLLQREYISGRYGWDRTAVQYQNVYASC